MTVVDRPRRRTMAQIIPPKTASPGALSGAPWGTPIVARHVADEIVDRMVTAVALGLYVPDQQLPPERDLAAMLGISRTTLREALGRLIEAGYLAVRRGRKGGTFVRASWGPQSAERVRRQIVDRWSDFEQIFDTRSLIEPLIARTAAERRSADDLAEMRRALQAYLDAPDHDASRRADGRLHLAIAAATQNATLVAVSVDLRTRITLNLGAEPYSDEVRRIAMEQHRALVDAIAGQRADQAASIAKRHFQLSEDLIRELARRAVDEDRGTKGVP